ncbi:right-handed parallel beta-helix repeat-containing protein [Microbacteriaceae bacterium 4G12]
MVVPGASAVADSSVSSGRYEGTSSAVTFGGTWGALAGKDSGGEVVRSTVTGSFAQLAFNSTGVKWIARTGPYFGIARVLIDGVEAGTVDLYSSTTQYQQVVFSRTGLTDGPHTIRIERIGKKNAASPTSDVVLDAFDVVDTVAPAAVSAVSGTVSGAGIDVSWSPSAEADVTGFRILRAVGAGDFAEVATGVSATGWRDGNVIPGGTYRYAVVAVDSSGNQAPRSVPATVAVADSSVRSGRYEGTSSAVTFGGTWGPLAGRDSGGEVVRATATGSFAQLAFNSTGVRWIARVGPFFGMARVWVDGVDAGTVDLYSSTTQYQQVVFSRTGLTDGPHTIRIERIGKKNAASPTSDVVLDAFDVVDTVAPAAVSAVSGKVAGAGIDVSWSASAEADVTGYRVLRAVGAGEFAEVATGVSATGWRDENVIPGGTYRYVVVAVDSSGNQAPRSIAATVTVPDSSVSSGRYEGTSSAVTFGGTWGPLAGKDSGGEVVRSTVTGSFAQLAFRSTGVKWVARTGPYFGIARVLIDGVEVGTVDLYSSVTKYQQTVFTRTGLTDGPHTIRIERVGKKNASAVTSDVVLDAFDVVDTIAPSAVSGVSGVVSGAGIDVSWSASAEADVVGYRVLRAVGSGEFVELPGGAVAGATTRDENVIPGTTYRYAVVAVDSSGNQAPRSVPATVAVTDSSVRSGRYEGISSAVTFGGTWGPLAGKDSAGEVVRSTVTGSFAQLAFNSTGVKWVARVGPYFGIARVLIDGVEVGTVDLYSSTTRYQQTVFTKTGLTDGPHTIRIERVGKKNASSVTSDVVLDAFDVVDTIAPSTVSGVSGAVSGAGIDVSWPASAEADVVGYRVLRAVGSGEFVELPGAPVAGVTVRDENVIPGGTYRYAVVAVDSSGNQAPRSIPATVTVPDSSVPSGRYEGTSSAVTFGGTWGPLAGKDSEGEVVRSTVTGSFAQLGFNSTGVKWTARTGPFFGIARVLIDGVEVGTVDLYSSVTKYQQTVFTRTGLTDGPHTIRIERVGKKNASSVTSDVVLDTFDVIDTVAPEQLTDVSAVPGRLGTRLTWAATEAGDLAHYRVYRTGGGETRRLISPSVFTARSFLDITRKEAVTYTYEVTAVDWGGNESAAAATGAVDTPRWDVDAAANRYVDCPAATVEVSTFSQLKAAVAAAQPGSVIRLQPGTYVGYVLLAASGTEDKPIWLCGPRTAILERENTSAGFAVHVQGAEHVIVSGMTIRNATQAVAVSSSSHVTVSDVHASNIGQEAIKIRYGTTDSTVIGNTIRNTGVVLPEYGEGIYLGTSPARWCEYTNCLPDRSDRNVVAYNDIAGTRADPIEAKQGTTGGTIIGNRIDGAALTEVTSLIYVKGNDYLIRDNVGTNAKGDAFIANFDYASEPEWGKRNVFVNNSATVLTSRYGVYVRTDYGNLVACNNTTAGTTTSITNVECRK